VRMLSGVESRKYRVVKPHHTPFKREIIVASSFVLASALALCLLYHTNQKFVNIETISFYVNTAMVKGHVMGTLEEAQKPYQ
jgi:hypothetical protein